MSDPNRERPFSPMAFCFLSASLGILTDFYFPLSVPCWKIGLLVGIFGLTLDVVRNDEGKFLAGLVKKSKRLFLRFVQRLLKRNAWAVSATSAVLINSTARPLPSIKKISSCWRFRRKFGSTFWRQKEDPFSLEKRGMFVLGFDSGFKNWSRRFFGQKDKRGVVRTGQRSFGKTLLSWGKNARNRGGRLWEALPLGHFFLFLTLFSVFGYRHSLCWRYFPVSEIGRLIQTERTPALVEGTLIQSPVVYEPQETFFPTVFQSEVSIRFVLRVSRIKNHGAWQEVSGKILVSIHDRMDELCVGDRVQLRGHLSPIASPNNPGDFDRAFQYRTQRILLTMSVPQNAFVTKCPPKNFFDPAWRWGFSRFFERLRKRAIQKLDESLTPENAALAKAMVLGYRSSLDEETTTLFRETGMVHLLAISGVHVGIFVGMLSLALFALGYLPRTIVFWLVAGVIFYLLLTTRPVSAIRAAIMVLIFLGGIWYQRKIFSVNSLCAAAVLILFWNPSELFQLGTQLSFLATGVFLWQPGQFSWFKIPLFVRRSGFFRRSVFSVRIFLHFLEETLSQRIVHGIWFRGIAPRRQWRIFRPWTYQMVEYYGTLFFRGVRNLGVAGVRLLCVSLVIMFVIAPLILFHWNTIAPVSVILNPLIWIPVSLVLGLFFLIVLCSWIFPWGCGVIGWGANGASQGMLCLLRGGHHLQGSSFWLASPSLFWCLGFYFPLIFWTLFPHCRPLNSSKMAQFLLIWIGVGVFGLFLTKIERRFEKCVQIEFFSVGHGNATLITFPDGKTVLYDCGSMSSPKQTAQTILKTLGRHGRNRLDVVLFSHADADHYNAFPDLLEHCDVGAVGVTPLMFEKDDPLVKKLKMLIEAHQIPICSLSAGQSLDFLGVPNLTVLYPGPAELAELLPDQTNAASLVVLLEYENRRILLPGDLDVPHASFLNNLPVKLDGLLTPHHGGKSQNYQALLRWGRPDFLVISGGHFQKNPQEEQLLTQKGLTVLHTWENGWIQVSIAPAHGRPSVGQRPLEISNEARNFLSLKDPKETLNQGRLPEGPVLPDAIFPASNENQREKKGEISIQAMRKRRTAEYFTATSR